MRSLALALLVPTLTATAIFQQPDWNMGGFADLTANLTTLATADQQGIQRALNLPSNNLRAARINTPSGNLFFIQASGDDCGASGNCTSWVIGSDYKILLKTIAQQIKIETPLHAGQPDILTTMHNSAYDGDLEQWQFDGTAYQPSACASYTYKNSFGDTYARARITPHPCPPH